MDLVKFINAHRNHHLANFDPEEQSSEDTWNSSYAALPTTTPSTFLVLDNGSGGTSTSPRDCAVIHVDYDPFLAVAAACVCLFGALFCFFGYRCYKSILFLTGFAFGLVIVFLICQEEALLPQYGNVAISALSGFLYGLICFLVPYVGFFTLGFHAGLLLGVAVMVLFPLTYSVWISIIFLLGMGLFGAVINVCFPSVTIVFTALIGGGACAASCDYFIENFAMVNWILAHMKDAPKLLSPEAHLCWFSWLILSVWPFLVIFGVGVQMALTARGFTIDTYPYKKRPRPRRLTREERALARQAKYRYLYQIRTAGGDIISQSYIEAVHKKPEIDTMSTHVSTLTPKPQQNGGGGSFLRA